MNLTKVSKPGVLPLTNSVVASARPKVSYHRILTNCTVLVMVIDIMNQEENATNKKIGTLKTEIDDQIYNQDRAQANEDAARARREDLSRQKNKLTNQIGTIIQSAGSADIGGKMLMAGGQMAATWILNLWASNDLQSAQRNMQDQLERGQEYRRRKEEAEVDIQKLSTQANELVQCPCYNPSYTILTAGYRNNVLKSCSPFSCYFMGL